MDKMLVAVFKSERQASVAAGAMKELCGEGVLLVYAFAVIVSNGEKISIADSAGEDYSDPVLGEVTRKLIKLLGQRLRSVGAGHSGASADAIMTMADIGVVYFRLGDFPRALDYYKQALAIMEEVGDRRTKAILLQSLGVLWKKTGETDKALDAQTQSLALARAVGDRHAEGRTLHAISELYILQGEKEKARESLTRALELARAAGLG